MEKLLYEFEGASQAVTSQQTVLVGAVGSGNLEVMIEAADLGGRCSVVIDTSIDGYTRTWEQVLTDFLQRHALRDVSISINDGGATPAVVSLRLDQAAAEFTRGAA